jgi:hypothetical protein
MIILHFGQGYMSKAILEREEEHSYELPMGSSEGKVILQKYCKLEPPLNNDQHTKLVLRGNQEKLYYWCNDTSHGPYTQQRNAENNAQEGRNSRGILLNLERHIGNQLED